MNNYEIKNATAIYTGGGIYIYYGQLLNGLYFRTCDDWGAISICDSDTSVEEADYEEFYHEHEIDNISDYDFQDFFNEMIDWILVYTPDGNYNALELEKRKFEHIKTEIKIERACDLKKKLQEQAKQEKFDNMMKHQVSMIESSMIEYRESCRFIFKDSDQYRRDFEKQWMYAFYDNAVRLFEARGYQIQNCKGYDLIKW